MTPTPNVRLHVDLTPDEADMLVRYLVQATASAIRTTTEMVDALQAMTRPGVSTDLGCSSGITVQAQIHGTELTHSLYLKICRAVCVAKGIPFHEKRFTYNTSIAEGPHLD